MISLISHFGVEDYYSMSNKFWCFCIIIIIIWWYPYYSILTVTQAISYDILHVVCTSKNWDLWHLRFLWHFYKILGFQVISWVPTTPFKISVCDINVKLVKYQHGYHMSIIVMCNIVMIAKSISYITVCHINIVQVGNGTELEAIGLQFEPYRWRPCEDSIPTMTNHWQSCHLVSKISVPNFKS